MTTTRAAEATKGPWKVDDGEALKVKGADGGTVASIFFASLTRRRPPEEAHANALLIAAAPALRDALEKAEQQLDYGQVDAALVIIRAALKLGQV